MTTTADWPLPTSVTARSAESGPDLPLMHPEDRPSSDRSYGYHLTPLTERAIPKSRGGAR